MNDKSCYPVCNSLKDDAWLCYGQCFNGHSKMSSIQNNECIYIAMLWVGGQAIRMETLLSCLLQLRTVSIDNVGANKDLKWHVANWSPCNM